MVFDNSAFESLYSLICDLPLEVYINNRVNLMSLVNELEKDAKKELAKDSVRFEDYVRFSTDLINYIEIVSKLDRYLQNKYECLSLLKELENEGCKDSVVKETDNVCVILKRNLIENGFIKEQIRLNKLFSFGTNVLGSIKEMGPIILKYLLNNTLFKDSDVKLRNTDFTFLRNDGDGSDINVGRFLSKRLKDGFEIRKVRLDDENKIETYGVWDCSLNSKYKFITCDVCYGNPDSIVLKYSLIKER